MLARQLGQRRLHLADGQRELHALALQPQAVHAGQQAVPLRRQLGGQRRQFGEGRDAADQIGRLGRREGRDGAVEQAGGPLPVLSPGVPGGEKVQAQAKVGLQHRPAGRNRPRRGARSRGQQAAALQEYLTREFQSAIAIRAHAALNVVGTRADGRAVVVP